MTATFVYCITNKINGKRYFGITMAGVALRWRQHQRSAELGKQTKLARAIRKYGPEAFLVKEIICLDRADAEYMESRLIMLACSFMDDEGYNITLGGGGTFGHRHTPEARQAIGLANKGRKPYKMSKEQRAKISASLKGRFLGRKMSAECIEKRRLKQKGRPCHPRTKRAVAKANRRRLGTTQAPRTAAQKLRMSLAHIGLPWSAARRAAYERSYPEKALVRDPAGTLADARRR